MIVSKRRSIAELRNNQDAAVILDELTKRLKTNEWSWLSSEDVINAIEAVYRTGAFKSYEGLRGAIKACEDAAEKMREAHKALGLEVPPKKTTRKGKIFA